VTEHFPSNEPQPSDPTSGVPNQFNDSQGAIPFLGLDVYTHQSFTITGPGIAPNTPVAVRVDGKDFGQLAIFRRTNGVVNGQVVNPTILINGQAAPDQKQMGTLCDNDHINQGH
jgi:hypothetical protein